MSKRLELPKYLRHKAVTAPPARGGRKLSEYGRQLREKQKARFAYGLREKQFRNYFVRAAQAGDATGQMLFQLLERRLDNVLYRFSLTLSRAQARQMVTHGHVLVGGKKVTIPSYLVRPGDTVQLVKVEPQNREVEIPSWLSYDKEKQLGTISHLPERADLDLEVNEQLIVEFYSR